MKRAKHNLGHYRLFTGDMGWLMPAGLVEVLPGDSFQHSTSCLLRLSPMVAPVMHPVSVRIHHFFVPHRIVWDGWEDFITGGPDGNNNDQIPVGQLSGDTDPNSLTDYLGVPPVDGMQYNRLPVLGYNTIWNEFYRDQDLIPEVDTVTNSIQRIAWEKDYLTSARPWPQKGDDITIPIGQTAPIVTNDEAFQLYSTDKGDQRLLGIQPETSGAFWDTLGNATGNFDGARFGDQTGLLADLSQAEAVNVNEFRRAFALQRYQEARARYGSRYTEYLRYLGIRPSDSRIQRPEYLGGGKVNVSISEVLQTAPENQGGGAPNTEYGVGDMYGHGIAATRSNTYRRFFEEHGYVHTLLSVRPRTMYVNNMPRHWNKRDKEDFYQRELVHIGQQAVTVNEVYADPTNGGDTFGYQDRYDEYRKQQSQVSAEFRELLNYWHLGRDFTGVPTLNESFVECAPSKRIFAEQSQHSLWIMAQHHLVARRLIGKRAMSRII